ncbi:beta-N-acetylhexosaminidase [Pedobacter flavus]|uniref:beta-N-acetylhexosaminidase n=1 Tax=Pedobacter flavus TaxID=3113906 RepID=A0ABU7GYU6_9SPHI|nr:family 20 glycosylhydrolase [Pedobacter sp. VNH31]MEE1884012.1 family 20 glycosylhydrolase [Pedobacter sp. VNH31]
MKKIFSILILSLIGFSGFAQPNAQQDTETNSFYPTSEIAIIPEPVLLKRLEGKFTLTNNFTIEVPANPELNTAIVFLKERLTIPTGYYAHIERKTATHADIRLLLNTQYNPEIGKEGYQLSVHKNQIIIKANVPAGLFYGIQTLIQLFPKEIESKSLSNLKNWSIPAVEITDYPKVEWRGLMFDVARHWFTKEEVMRFIDDMVRYKYNILHFHLTDDEGWRVEIKGLPRLTEVGAWRVKKEGEFGAMIPPGPNEPRNYGGFYTQEDIKEIVKYAADRFVNVMPEVDVPGHSLAAIAAYPELSCTPEAVNYKVRSGERIMDWSRGAPPTALVDNTLCPANEKVYEFLDTVITQIAALFPFEYIHMGGDEAPHNFWQNNPQIKALMAKEGLKTMPDVQGYFTRRVEKIVESKGKKYMGWDEILEGNISSSTAIMNWRTLNFAIEATKNKHEVVLSPTAYAYLDYMQADPITEPRVYASLRLSKSYEFDPIPPGVDPKYIKGGQGNLWTEQVYNMRQVQYMLWPRAFAISESLWTPKENKDWKHFFAKTEEHFKRLDLNETKYAPSVYDPIFEVKRTADKQLSVKLSTEIEGLDIYYSFDNSFPDRFYPKYTEPLVPPVDATVLKVITYRGKDPIGRMLNMPISELQKRAPNR